MRINVQKSPNFQFDLALLYRKNKKANTLSTWHALGINRRISVKNFVSILNKKTSLREMSYFFAPLILREIAYAKRKAIRVTFTREWYTENEKDRWVRYDCENPRVFFQNV